MLLQTSPPCARLSPKPTFATLSLQLTNLCRQKTSRTRKSTLPLRPRLLRLVLHPATAKRSPLLWPNKLPKHKRPKCALLWHPTAPSANCSLLLASLLWFPPSALSALPVAITSVALFEKPSRCLPELSWAALPMATTQLQAAGSRHQARLLHRSPIFTSIRRPCPT